MAPILTSLDIDIYFTELPTSISGMTAVALARSVYSVFSYFGFYVVFVSVVSSLAASSFPSVSISCATETVGADLKNHKKKKNLLIVHLFILIYSLMCKFCGCTCVCLCVCLIKF